MAYTRLLYHIVIATYRRAPAIPIDNEAILYRYLWRFIQERKGILYRMGGMPDHIHMLIQLPPTVAIADFVKDMKAASHKFLLRNTDHFPHFQNWSTGYCALSYCQSEISAIDNYIRGQKLHHQHETFHDELLRLLQQSGVQVDMQHFLND